MADISSLTSVDNFILSLLAVEDKDNDEFFRYKQMAMEGLQEFNIQHFDNEKTVEVTPTGDGNTFAYPSDYVRYVMIGTPIEGRWWYFTREESMVPFEDDSDVANEINPLMPNIAEYNLPNDLSSGGGTNRYYFKDSPRNRTFQAGGFTPDVVVLRYVSTGITSDGDAEVPIHARNALQHYVRWRIADYDDWPESTTLRLERQMKEAIKSMKRAQRPTMQDIRDAISASSSQLLRR